MLPRNHWFDTDFRPCNDAYLARVHGPYARPTAQHHARSDLHTDFQWALSLDQQRATHDSIVT